MTHRTTEGVSAVTGTVRPILSALRLGFRDRWPRTASIVTEMLFAQAAVNEATVRLFQYGSNMSYDCFFERIRREYDEDAPLGTLILLGPASLSDWELQLNLWSATRGCRVLNMVEEKGSEVWGALYEIASDLVTRCDGKRSVVDRLEGHRTRRHPENYAKICVTVVDVQGEAKTAWTYIGLREAADRCERDHPGTTCDSDYADVVVAGARSTGVPDEYLLALQAKLGQAR